MVLKTIRVSFLFSFLALAACATNEEDSGGATEESEETTEDAGETTDSGGELRVAVGAIPPILDSHISIDTNGSIIGRNIFETLVTFDSEYNIQPMLAESWEESEDGTTFTFNLREDVLFHNGEEMMAEDVVASLERWLSLSTLGIEIPPEEANLEAEDDYTVVLELANPVPYVLETLAYGGANFASIMPEDIIDNADGSNVDEYVGTGPYQLEEWAQDQYIHLSDFEDYQAVEGSPDGLSGEREAIIDDLYFMHVPDIATREAGVETGEYDVAMDVNYDNVERLESLPNLDINAHPFGMYVIVYNKDTGLFADERAREALSLAIDKEGILQAAFASEDFYTLDHNMMTDQSNSWVSNEGEQEYYQHDPEEAQQLLNDAGYDGEEITILASRHHDYYYNGSVVLQQQLEQLGLNVNLEIQEWSSYLDLRSDPENWDLFLGASTPSVVPTSLSFLRSDYLGWTDSPEIDSIIEDFNLSTSEEETEQLFDEMQAWFHEYRPVTKVGDFSKAYAVNENVEYEFQDGPIFWNTSIAE